MLCPMYSSCGCLAAWHGIALRIETYQGRKDGPVFHADQSRSELAPDASHGNDNGEDEHDGDGCSNVIFSVRVVDDCWCHYISWR
jgi:hypothetical protein